MPKKPKDSIPGQGTLFGESPNETGYTEGSVPVPELPPRTGAVDLEAGVFVGIKDRGLQLSHALGHLANISKTSKYETIDEDQWFQRKIRGQHPHDYQQHVDEVLANRDKFKGLAKNSFAKAFGRQAMIESGLLTEAEADELTDDFYYGRNKSGLNDESKSFLGSYADPKKQQKPFSSSQKTRKTDPIA